MTTAECSLSHRLSNVTKLIKDGDFSNAEKTLFSLKQNNCLSAEAKKVVSFIEKNYLSTKARIGINFSKIDLDNTLGVLHFSRKLIASLVEWNKKSDIILLFDKEPPPEDKVKINKCRCLNVKNSSVDVDVEILLHQFQTPLTDSPFIYIVHDLHVWDVPWKYKGKAESMQRHILEMASKSKAVISHFPRTYVDLKKMIPHNKKIFKIVSPTMQYLPPSSEDEIKKVRNSFFKNNAIDYLLFYPAQLQHHKNHINLLRALRILLNQGMAVGLLCTGSLFDDSLHEQFKNILLELELYEYVAFLGRVSDEKLSLVYQSVDLIVHPSLAEGGAYIAQEALHYKKPIVLSNIRSVKMHLEMMGGEWTTFNPNSPAEISKAIRNQLHNPNVNAQVSKFIFSNWTWNKAGEQVDRIVSWITNDDEKEYFEHHIVNDIETELIEKASEHPEIKWPIALDKQNGNFFGSFLRSENKHIEETDLIKEYLSEVKEGLMIDVGAHRGTACLQFLDDGWNIIAFEPDKENRLHLEKKISNRCADKIEILPVAVGNKSEKNVPFYASDVSSGISSLSAFHESHELQNHIDIVTLKEILRDKNYPHVNFLKIDTEGHDLFVLQGFPWNKIKPDVIECEFEDFKTLKLGYSYTDLANYLVNLGYNVIVSEWYPITKYGVRHDWRSIGCFPSELHDKKGWGNLLAFREEINFSKINKILYSQLFTAENNNPFQFIQRNHNGNVRKIANGKYQLLPLVDKNYICDIYSAEILSGSLISADVTCFFNDDCSITISLIRHGNTKGESTSKTFKVLKGENSFSLQHTFKYNHKGMRIQIGVNDKAVTIHNIRTKVKNLKKEKANHNLACVLDETNNFPDVFGNKAKLSFYLNNLFNSDDDCSGRFPEKINLNGNVKEIDNSYVFSANADNNYLASLFFIKINIGRQVYTQISCHVDRPCLIKVTIIRHGQTIGESYSENFNLNKKGIHKLELSSIFKHAHNGFRIQLGIENPSEIMIKDLSIIAGINALKKEPSPELIKRKVNALYELSNSFINAVPELTKVEMRDVSNCFISFFNSFEDQKYEDIFLSAKDLPIECGKKEGKFVTKVVVNDLLDKNKSIFNFQRRLPVGNYIFEIEYDSNTKGSALIDIYTQNTKIVSAKTSAGNSELLSLHFELNDINEQFLLGFRCQYLSGQIKIYGIRIKRKLKPISDNTLNLPDFSFIKKESLVAPKVFKPLTTEPITVEDINRMEKLKDYFKGKRIFIMGSGPSLNKTPLEKLENEYVFGLNRIGLLFDRIKWRPTFYTAFDIRVVPDNAVEFASYDIPYKFFSARYKNLLGLKENHYWYHTKAFYNGFDGCFDENVIYSGFGGGGTIAVMAIELAFYMGFDPIYLIGTDVSYKIPKTVKQDGEDVFGTGNKILLTSTEDDDINHFDPRYYGAGKKWHDPNVEDMKIGFARCRQYIEKRNRKIYNATVGGELEVMQRVCFDDLF